jgi:hypothetical protein
MMSERRTQPETRLELSRRELMARGGMGLSSLALSYLLGREARAESLRRGHDLTPKAPHFKGPARAVIQLVQTGGPSQMDLFDAKPELRRLDGKTFDQETEPLQPGSEANKLLGSPFEFHRHGECGMELSELIPDVGEVADDISLIRSQLSTHNNHTEAIVTLATGFMNPGRPSLGSWVSYALGTENRDLPAYVVLRDPNGYATSGGLMVKSEWLPAIYGGTEFNTQGAPVHNLTPKTPRPAGAERNSLELIARLNERQLRGYRFEPDLEARIRNYELAARMQLSATDVLDVSQESQKTRELYGLHIDQKRSYGTRCLMARRLVEAGVRFVQVFVGAGQPWDQHQDLRSGLMSMSYGNTPSTGLIKDLKERGLLDSTVVLWAGEFGRLPVSQETPGSARDGRDHNKYAGSMWIAGGGFKRGFVYGATDDVGFKAVEKIFTMPDMFATVAHTMGLDHDDVTFEHQGHVETMTDSKVSDAKVHHELLL